jgi:hypothetical protein
MTALCLLASLALAQDQPAAAVGTHSGVSGLVLARPFTLAQPATFSWVKEQPSYDAGWLVVVRVDPELIRRARSECRCSTRGPRRSSS